VALDMYKVASDPNAKGSGGGRRKLVAGRVARMWLCGGDLLVQTTRNSVHVLILVSFAIQPLYFMKPILRSHSHCTGNLRSKRTGLYTEVSMSEESSAGPSDAHSARLHNKYVTGQRPYQGVH
jgi:hypothetical protein